MIYYPEPDSKFELDLSNYTTKSDVKNITGVDT